VIALTLARRGELIRASTLAEVSSHEVSAQDAKLFCPTAPTFAASSDVHTNVVPPAARGNEYAPGALAPDMPTLLVGKRADRVEQARALSVRADSLVEKLRGLLTLEADDAFQRWTETSKRLPKALETEKKAFNWKKKMFEDVTQPLDLKVTYADVTAAILLANQLKMELNDILYHNLLNLADLERITAGGIDCGLVPAH
jgi:hypothetical protein